MIRALMITVSLLMASTSNAQTIPPLGDDLHFPPLGIDARIAEPASVAELEVSGAPRQVLVWLERGDDLYSVYASMIDRFGTVLVDRELLFEYDNSASTVGRLGPPSVAASGDGRFVVVIPQILDPQAPDGHQNAYRKQFLYRSYLPVQTSGGALDPLMSGFALLLDANALFQSGRGIPEHAPDSADLAAAPFGRFALVFADDRNPEDVAAPCYTCSRTLSTNDNSVHFQYYDMHSDGTLVPLLPEPVIVANNAEAMARPRIALEPNSGAARLVYRRADGSLVLGLFDAAGQAAGDPIIALPRDPDVQVNAFDPDVAVDLQGTAWVAWELNRYRTLENAAIASRIQLQPFGVNGAPLGEVVDASTAGEGPANIISRRGPYVAANDVAGHVAVAWSEAESTCIGLNPPIPQYSGSCSVGGALPQGGGVCTLSGMNPNSPSLLGCRVSARLVPLPELPSSGWYSFDRDTRRDFVIDGAGGTAFTLRFGSNFSSQNNRCVNLELSGNFSSVIRTLEQQCTGSSCRSCADQLGGSADKSTVAVNFDANSELLPELDEGGIAAQFWLPAKASFSDRPQNIAMRWLHRDFNQPGFTFVPQLPVNQISAGIQQGAALGQYRDGDMLLAWAGDGPGSAEPNVIGARRFTRPVELSINDIGILEGPIEATGTFTVSASKAHPIPGVVPRVSYLTADDTASFLSDYTRTTGIAEFTAGASSRFVPVPVTEDTTYEDNETFFINLFGGTDAVVVKAQGIGVIIDNDPPETVTAENTLICESGQPLFLGMCAPLPAPVTPNPTVTVRLSLPFPQEVDGNVQFRTLDGTNIGNPVTSVPAIAGVDYEPVSGEAQFPAGSTEAFVSVEIIDNSLLEMEKNFRVELFEAEDLTLEAGANVAIVRIANNDTCSQLPQVSLPSGAPLLELAVEGGTAYACVQNFDPQTCSWRSSLSFPPGQPTDWLSRTDVVGTPPAAAGCGANDNGYVELVAESNVPQAGGGAASGQSRSAQLVFESVAAPSTVSVVQAGIDCDIHVQPDALAFYPVGGQASVQIQTLQPDGQVGNCVAAPWSLNFSGGAENWVENLRVDGQPVSGGVGAATLNFEVMPFDGVMPGRSGALLVGAEVVSLDQEGAFFDEFDDTQTPLGWAVSSSGVWTEAGTQLTGSSTDLQTIIADQAFPGCLECEIETTIRMDVFGKGLGVIYAWYVDADNHIYLSMDEFRDEWRLVQRIGGNDQLIRSISINTLPSTQYPLRLYYDAQNAAIELTIGGTTYCPPAVSGLQLCSPQALAAGTVGFGVDDATVSFDRIRIVRQDGPPYTGIVVDSIYADGFE